MSTPGPGWWKEMSPYLDQALTMTGEDRAAWLGSLPTQNPPLAAQLEALLHEHSVLGQEHFLEQGLAVPHSILPTQTGQIVGAYALLSPIGEGGMGSVWLAERNDGQFEGRAAVRLLNISLLRRGGERFKREGTILARLAHPHIAQLLDAGVSPAGQPFLILEYVEGKNIVVYCDQNRLGVEARVRLFLDMLDAVAHAHANLVVHRDIKPSNVLVRMDGQVKLLDFGIAKLLEDDGHAGAATQLTREGGAALTPEYAAPEQITGDPVTTATDVYSSGALFYVLLTGKHPAGNGHRSTAELVKSIVDIEPPRPSDVVVKSRIDAQALTAHAARRAVTPDKLHRVLQGDLDIIVAKALKKNPQERYASVTAFADDLRRYLRHEPIGARPDTLVYRAARFVRRNRATVALASLAFVVSVAGVVATIVQARTVRAQRDFALRELSRAEALNDLNSFVLSDAAPSGKPFTVNDLLERAEHMVEKQRGGDAADRVGLLASIGYQYHTLKESAKARKLLDEAYQLSRGLTDRHVRARAACGLTSVLAYSGEMQRGEALFQEGLGELPSDAPFVLDRIFCLLRGGEVASERGASLEGLVRVQTAQRLLKQSPVHPESLELDAFIDLAQAYRVAGQQHQAIAAFEQASSRLAALGRDDTETAVSVLHAWALALLQLGRPHEAEPIFHRAIEISQADPTTNRGVSPILLRDYGRALRYLGRFDEAAHYEESAYSTAQHEGNATVVDTTLLERSRIYREQGNFPRAEAMLSEVEPRFRRDLPAGHYAFAMLDAERALLAQARGDLPMAMDLINGAIIFLDAAVKAGQRGSNLVPLFLVSRSNIELQLHHDDKAGADANRALTIGRQTAEPATYSCDIGQGYLALRPALLAQGKQKEAHEAFHSAEENLQNTLGPDHPDSRAARQLSGLNPMIP